MVAAVLKLGIEKKKKNGGGPLRLQIQWIYKLQNHIV